MTAVMDVEPFPVGRMENTAANPLLTHLKRECLVCPFAVEADAYSALRRIPIATYCWFMAERYREGIGDDAKMQILASCSHIGAYDRCAVYRSVQGV